MKKVVHLIGLRTKEQHKRLFGVLSALGKSGKEDRSAFALQYSDGRTDSTAQLYQGECELLIAALQEQLPNNPPRSSDKEGANGIRRFIIHLCHQMGWQANGAIDIARVDGYCKEYGYLHKALNEYTLAELPKLKRQFEKFYQEHLKALNK